MERKIRSHLMNFQDGLAPNIFIASCRDYLQQVFHDRATEEHAEAIFKQFLLGLTKFLLGRAAARSSWPYNLSDVAPLVRESFELFFEKESILLEERPKQMSTILCDLFWLLDTELGASSPAAVSYLAELLSFFVKMELMKSEDCIVTLEAELLSAAELIPSKETFNKKLIRMNTSLLYKQQRYNLFAEDTEAFSMVLFLLKEARSTLFNDLMCLVGSFDLDANRVIDLLLGEWISRPLQLAPLYSETLKKFNCPHIGNIIGLKLQYLKGYANATKSLLFISGCLIRDGILSVNEILLFIHDDATLVEVLAEHLFRLGLLMKGISLLRAFPSVSPGADTFSPFYEALSLYIHPFMVAESIQAVSLAALESSRLYTHAQLLAWNNLPNDPERWLNCVFALMQLFSPCKGAILLKKLLTFGRCELSKSKESSEILGHKC